MTLDKAIEVLKELACTWSRDYDDEDLQAVRLLIEAGKRVQNQRRFNAVSRILLPGETAEGDHANT